MNLPRRRLPRQDVGHEGADLGCQHRRAGSGARDNAKPVTLDLRKVYTAVSDDHVEIMRDDLSEIFYDATRNDVEYVFADSIYAGMGSGTRKMTLRKIRHTKGYRLAGW